MIAHTKPINGRLDDNLTPLLVWSARLSMPAAATLAAVFFAIGVLL
jgi:hypothetical protein